MKGRGGNIILVIALVGFVFSGFMTIKIWREYKVNEESYKRMQNYGPTATDENIQKFKESDYKDLSDINADLIAWLKIPNTVIDYPIVRNPNDEYYMTHNFEKRENDGGTIFAESVIKNPFEDENTILHGHNMRDGSMFAALNKYKEEDFFKNNNNIYISTKNVSYTYQVFSAYVEKVSSEPYKYSFPSNEDYVEFLRELKNKSMFYTDEYNLTEKDKIITLSTCSYEVTDGRLLVHARLIDKDVYSE